MDFILFSFPIVCCLYVSMQLNFAYVNLIYIVLVLDSLQILQDFLNKQSCHLQIKTSLLLFNLYTLISFSFKGPTLFNKSGNIGPSAFFLILGESIPYLTISCGASLKSYMNVLYQIDVVPLNSQFGKNWYQILPNVLSALIEMTTWVFFILLMWYSTLIFEH